MSSAATQHRGPPTRPHDVDGPYDGFLSHFTQRCASDAVKNNEAPLPTLLREFFSFLHRKTDLYYVRPDQEEGRNDSTVRNANMGFPLGTAEKIVLASFRKFPLRKVPSTVQNGTTSGDKSRNTASKAMPSTGPLGSNEKVEKKKIDSAKARKDKNESLDAEKSAKEPQIDARKNPPKKAAEGRGEANVRYTEEGLQIPVGNGGVTSRYYWTQTLNEVSIIIEESGSGPGEGDSALPRNVRGKDLAVEIKATTGTVRLKHSKLDDVILEGKWGGKVRSSESSWSIETDHPGAADNGCRCLVLTLDKMDPVWWSEAIIDDGGKIDTELVDSTRKIDTYDEHTQGELRRMLFDQRAERLGLPSSAEIMGKGGGVGTIPGGKNVLLPDGVEIIDPQNIPSKKS